MKQSPRVFHLEQLFFQGCDRIQRKHLNLDEELDRMLEFAYEMKRVREAVLGIFRDINTF